MPSRMPLPDDLTNRSFDRAAARRVGVPAGRLRRKDVRRPFRGVQSLNQAESPSARCQEYAVRLKPEQFRSPAESTVRLVLESAGLPRPELNAPIHDTAGRYLGREDLVWRRQRVVLEYEGDHHRTDRDQFRYDIERYERFKEAGWHVVRVTADDLREDRRAQLVARVRRYLGA